MKPPTACFYLNNKHYFFPPPVDPKDAPDEPGTPFWCLKTHDAIGPDGAEVGEHCCRPERPCFRPEVELPEVQP
ncbi:MAG: hypothetical protein ACYTEZ_06110 [Planctomycetota bacterium]|jgi:hypothetical protein